ncbi:MAG: HAMP domain-containing sensor histidine kinase, partial [Pseudomonadota bacterium]
VQRLVGAANQFAAHDPAARTTSAYTLASAEKTSRNPVQADARPLSELAIVAHELYSPLAAIEASATLMRLRQEECSADMRTLIKRIQTHSQRCAQIVHLARELVGSEGQSLQDVDLVSWLHDVVTQHERPVAISLDFACETDTLPCSINALAVETVVRNLIDNAVHAVERVDHNDRVEPNIRVELTLADATPGSQSLAHIDVLDTGCGLAHSDTTQHGGSVLSNKPNGLGLGLQICRTLAEALDGDLSLTERPTGARARLTIPLVDHAQRR